MALCVQSCETRLPRRWIRPPSARAFSSYSVTSARSAEGPRPPGRLFPSVPYEPVCAYFSWGGEERRVPSESGAWLGCHLRSGGGSPTAPLSCPTSEGHVWGDPVGSHCKNRPRGAGAAGTPHQQAHARAAASLSDGPQMLSRSSWEETGPIKPNTLANGEKDERDRQRVSRSRAGLHTSLPSRSAHIALTVRNKICPLQN